MIRISPTFYFFNNPTFVFEFTTFKMETSRSLTYKILLHKEPEGTYTVSVPALPGCITYGNNIDHAIEMAKEAIELYVSELKALGKEVPDDSSTLEYSLNLIDA